VLACMYNLDKQMSMFHSYIIEEKNSNKSLHQWSKYTGYPELHRVSRELKMAVEHLKITRMNIRGVCRAARLIEPRKLTQTAQTLLPRKYTLPYYDRALNFSTSTSRNAASALEMMNVKAATCLDDVEKSSLSDTASEMAKHYITAELGKMLKHCITGTNTVYAAMDLLQKVLCSAMHDDMDQDITSAGSAKCRCVSLVVAVVLSLGFVACYICAKTSMGNGILHSLSPASAISEGYAVVDIATLQASLQDTVDAVAEVNKLDNLVTSARFRHLDEAYASTGYRIDSIWEALGPPNTNGSYEFGSHTCKLNSELSQEVQQIREHVGMQLNKVYKKISELEGLHKEVIDLGRHIHRVDIRLTNRLDRLKS